MSYQTMEKTIYEEFEMVSFVNPGDFIEGYLIEAKEVTTKHGDTKLLLFNDGLGNKSGMFCGTQLAKLDYEPLLQQKVKIIYSANKKNEKTGHTYKDFDILHDDKDILK